MTGKMTRRSRFINGARVAPAGAGVISVTDPATEEGAPNPLAPFGGFRQSGHGREYGKFGLEEFLSPKSLQL
jgi:acyl-CoA reductase-like NAD-dependent aldehyde dehydrogenase